MAYQVISNSRQQWHAGEGCWVPIGMGTTYEAISETPRLLPYNHGDFGAISRHCDHMPVWWGADGEVKARAEKLG